MKSHFNNIFWLLGTVRKLDTEKSGPAKFGKTSKEGVTQNYWIHSNTGRQSLKYFKTQFDFYRNLENGTRVGFYNARPPKNETFQLKTQCLNSAFKNTSP